MIELELQLVRENPTWCRVLQAYQVAQEELAARQAAAAEKSLQAAKSPATRLPTSDGGSINIATSNGGLISESGHSSEDDSDNDEQGAAPKRRVSRWVPRITKLPGVESAELSKIHGRLIAYDLLKCDLAGQSAGMVYQLTSTGKEVLTRCGDDELAEAA